MKTSTSTAAAVLGAATAAAVLLLGAGAASAEPHVTSSAYVLRTGGVLSVSPTPYAQSVDGARDRESVADISALPQVGPAKIALSALVATAEGNAASADVAQVDLAGLLRADVVHTWCVGGEGGLDVVNGTLLGRPLTGPVPHQVVDLSPVLRLELNAQSVENGALTVTGLRLSVLPSGGDLTAPLDAATAQLLPTVYGLVGVAPPAVAPVTVGGLLDVLRPQGEDTLLSVTIGSTTCAVDDAQEPAGGPGPASAAADDTEPAVQEVPAPGSPVEAATGTAPAPVVQRFSLPVTG